MRQHNDVVGHETPRSRCPGCGRPKDGAADVQYDDGRPPQAGDAAICGDCGMTCIYTEALTLRWPTTSELRELEETPGYHQAIRIQRRSRALLN